MTPDIVSDLLLCAERIGKSRSHNSVTNYDRTSWDACIIEWGDVKEEKCLHRKDGLL